MFAFPNNNSFQYMNRDFNIQSFTYKTWSESNNTGEDSVHFLMNFKASQFRSLHFIH